VEDALPRRWRRALPGAAGLIVVAGIVVGVGATLAGPGDDGSLRTDEGEAEVSGDPEAAGAAQPEPATSSVVAPQATATTAAPVQATTTARAAATPTTAVPVRPGARLQVKFVDGSGVRLRDGGFVSLTGRDLTAVTTHLARYPGTVIERLFSRSEEELAAEKAAIEASSGRPQPDLNLYYRLTLPAGADQDAAIAGLTGLGVVERAYADPAAAPPPVP